MPESVCTVALLCLMALLLLMVCSGLPAVQTSQQQVVLLTQGVVYLPLLLANLKHSCQLCLRQYQAECSHKLAAASAKPWCEPRTQGTALDIEVNPTANLDGCLRQHS